MRMVAHLTACYSLFTTATPNVNSKRSALSEALLSCSLHELRFSSGSALMTPTALCQRLRYLEMHTLVTRKMVLKARKLCLRSGTNGLP